MAEARWYPKRLFTSRGAWLLNCNLYRRVFRIEPDPKASADWAEIRDGQQVVELGSGPGYYTPTLARRVGSGTVHAVDIQKAMLNKLEHRLEGQGIQNVKTHNVDAAKLPLEDGSIDVVWALYVLEEVPDLEAVARDSYRVLKPGGTVVVAQFSLDFDRTQREMMKKIFPQVGFAVLEEVDTWWTYKVKYQKPRA